ncbi:hypothetical protein NJF54_19865 [Pseudomonas guariconensis]|uniref:hypothetical protein n=1 Tax=Pseudomonas guariconensis TaxID=1288410 RepID=UPI00209BB2D8|nr:hypothetical protein [Pseudomonas guariconensis]MCO7634081.1 hypothetical protein [Pseudomonas guariconensis]
MPTENRSSNTEMVSVPREHVEEAAKWLECHSPGSGSAESYAAQDLREALAKPAEQPQGEPVAWQDPENGSRMCTAEHKAYALSKGGAAALALATLTRPLYPHADPGEVERLRDDLDECDGERWKLRNERDTLRAQLAERDALLEEAYRDGWNDGQEAIEQRYQTTPRTSTDGWERFKAANALSASAEPTQGGCPMSAKKTIKALREERDQLYAEIRRLQALAGEQPTIREMARDARAGIKAEPSAPVESDGLSPDEINQMAFEEGQPAEDGDGYTFTQEEFDLFVQRLLDRAALEHKPSTSDDLAAFNAAFQKAMEAGWDDPIDLARQLWNARGGLERKPALDTKMIGIVHTPPAEYDEP